jgi:hypothetical protein
VRERRERDIDFQRHWKENCMSSSGVRGRRGSTRLGIKKGEERVGGSRHYIGITSGVELMIE